MGFFFTIFYMQRLPCMGWMIINVTGVIKSVPTQSGKHRGEERQSSRTTVWKQEWSCVRNGGLSCSASTRFSTMVHSTSSSWITTSFFRILIAYSSSVPFLSASITCRKEKGRRENPPGGGGKVTQMPEELERWQASFSFNLYRQIWSKPHNYDRFPAISDTACAPTRCLIAGWLLKGW